MRRSHLADGCNGYNAPVYKQHGQSQLVEEENEQLASQFSDKVKTLKSLSIDIGHEVREQNKFLKSLDDDFDKSGGFLQSTMARVTAMAKSGHNCYILYLILFAMFVFFICWVIIKTR
jgi:blocked-early-in-transport protein 1